MFGIGFASRMAASMWVLTLTLLTLHDYRSPQLAGLVSLANLGPAVPIGLVAGALLDRYGRRPLMAADQVLALIVALAVAGLRAEGRLTPALLITLTAIGALTLPLTQIGVRSLKPLLVPAELWDRANGLDNALMGVGAVAGASLAGFLVGRDQPELAMGVIAALYLLGAACVLTIREPRVAAAQDSARPGVLQQTREGARYATTHPVLRVAFPLLALINLTVGMGDLALTAVLLDVSGSAAIVGLTRGLRSLAEITASVVSGRISSVGRERRILLVCMAAQAAVYGGLAFVHVTLTTAVAWVLIGLLNGPVFLAYTALIQRATEPRMYTRATSAITVGGVLAAPVGSVLAGVLIGVSTTIALLVVSTPALATSLLALALPVTVTSAGQSARSSEGTAP